MNIIQVCWRRSNFWLQWESRHQISEKACNHNDVAFVQLADLNPGSDIPPLNWWTFDQVRHNVQASETQDLHTKRRWDHSRSEWFIPNLFGWINLGRVKFKTIQTNWDAATGDPLKKKAAHGNKWVNIRMSVRETVFLDTSSPLTLNNCTKLTATELHIEVYM